VNDSVRFVSTALWHALVFLLPAASIGAAEYVPPRGTEWVRHSPERAGFDPARLRSAIDFAVANETAKPRDLALTIALTRAREPFDAIIGPTQPRGAPTGVILLGGYVVAQWGEPDRVDMTFSVTKSFLSTVVGLALDRGKIQDVNAPVRGVLPGDLFESGHNRDITWNQLLRQTSNWRGTLWGKPDWADRPSGDDPFAWPDAPVPAPGAAYEYNDVRVNLLALLALHVWREALPAVLKREVMDPIGASDTWRWTGYENSYVELDGKRVQSVSGGGHWGGGMFINAWDMARFGLLCQRRGRWGERQIYSERWHEFATTPTDLQPAYGVMNWFLNTDRKPIPAAPASAFSHLGDGTNMIYVDPEHDLVVVARWIKDDQRAALIERVLSALKTRQSSQGRQLPRGMGANVGVAGTR
jgi:CubicO group peptidase (beta-lactamase class C family)